MLSLSLGKTLLFYYLFIYSLFSSHMTKNVLSYQCVLPPPPIFSILAFMATLPQVIPATCLLSSSLPFLWSASLSLSISFSIIFFTDSLRRGVLQWIMQCRRWAVVWRQWWWCTTFFTNTLANQEFEPEIVTNWIIPIKNNKNHRYAIHKVI